MPMDETRRERKVITVLFCDLVGFTAQAETMDPEDVEAVLHPYHTRVRSELERHGGTVEKFIGDAVMALFGAPVAHEDDPERAVRAAIAIRNFAVEDGLELRVGITTGEALVSLGASAAEGEGMASGDVVNTAARLQAAAPVNGIFADETTYRATRHAIDYEEAPAVEAKGKSQPIAVWKPLDARSRFGVDVAFHARAELVGRERELAVLRDALDRARHERIPQLVTLVGVPGMGKSRLVYELSRIVDADPELVNWRQGRCLAYGDGVAFWALAEVVKAHAGILERDDDAQVAEKLRAAVADALADPSDRRWVESHLRPLVGLDAETSLGGDRRSEAFAAWRRYLEALAEQRALVLVFEDLHWADEGLLDFLDELVDWLSGVPLLVVCSARPELLQRRPGWGGGKLNASTLGLSPLSEEQTALLISHVLERPVLPAEIQQTLVERAEGNPLYAEQFAQLYLERGSADELPLPETLQGIVAARLDGLSTDEKAVLQDAAVMGKVFWVGALRRDPQKAGALLHSLERKGFLTRQRRSSVEGESEWAFAHMLLRDVAYGQIPRAERAERHRLASEWIETLARPEEHAEMLAHHCRTGLELALAAGRETEELAERARLALRAAGDRAFALSAFPAATSYYSEALSLWPEGDEGRPGVLFRRAHALFASGDEGRADALEEARDALLAVGDRHTAAEAEAFLAQASWHRGQRDAAFAHLERAQELGADGPPSTAHVRVLAHSARMRVIAGEPEEGLRIAREGLAIAEALGLDELRAHALATIGMARYRLGDDDGARDLERGLEIALEASSPTAATILNGLASLTIDTGDLVRAKALYAEARRIAERFGDAQNIRWLRGQQVWIDCMTGRWDDALPAADEFIAECRAGSPHYLELSVSYVRGLIRLARGDSAGALDDHRRSVELARGAKDPQAVSPALILCARAYAVLGQLDEVSVLADELRAVARAYPSEAVGPLSVLFVSAELPNQHDLRDVVEAARRSPWKEAALAALDSDFGRAACIFAEMGSPPWEAEARLRAAERLIEAGRRAEGEIELQKAVSFYRSVGATAYVRRGEALLAASA